MPRTPAAFIGLDLGTSGCRAAAIDADGRQIAWAENPMPAPVRRAAGHSEQDPAIWRRTAFGVLKHLGRQLGGAEPAAICVDATSASILLAAPDGAPLGRALMYDDRRAVAAADRIADAAPADSPARGPTSSLAKLLELHARIAPETPVLVLHQADWISGQLTGHHGCSDWNNALKLGYDAARPGWPAWMLDIIPRGVMLPEVLAPGTRIGTLANPVAAAIGFPPSTRILAGTTDSTAAVIAAGARQPGDAVTSLGSTLVVKIVSAQPVTASRYGVYSQRLGDAWLAGGASNSGGAVLRQFFTLGEIEQLSASIDPEASSGLDYYPLPGIGERFPRHAPDLAPRLQPRPAEPERFLHALLEGLASIEAEGYARLQALGAPHPTRILTVGGGAKNAVWTRLRQRILSLPVEPAAHQEAAFGAARLALTATQEPGRN